MSPRRQPWRPGAATGIGSLPGTDILEATRLVFGELPDLPYLPELPARGAGADMIGRAVALLVDMPVEIVPSGWRLTARGGRDLRVAQDFADRDLDALQQVAGELAGPVKLQVAGPWTLAASVELPNGHRVVSDHGATRELTESLIEGVRRQLADVARRLPAASVVLQVDEPSLPAVLNGRVPTPSGWGSVRSVAASSAEETLGRLLELAAVGSRIVHCCAADAPLAMLRDAGSDALAIDATSLDAATLDAIGEAVDAGVAILLGVVPSTDSAVTVDETVDRVERIWQALGFARGRLAGSIVPSTACGLAGASPAYARHAMTVLREAGRRLDEEAG
jgi:methionine synthase II (cobalamin-independent)